MIRHMLSLARVVHLTVVAPVVRSLRERCEAECRTTRLFLSAWCFFMPAAITLAADPAYVALTVYPPRVQLDSSRDRQRIVVQARHADGRTVEVTATAEVTLTNPKLAAIDKANGGKGIVLDIDPRKTNQSGSAQPSQPADPAQE
jgi:hypothetical protein